MAMVVEKVWLNKSQYDEAERRYYENSYKKVDVKAGDEKLDTNEGKIGQNLISQIARCRQEISLTLRDDQSSTGGSTAVVSQLELIKKENQELKKEVSDLKSILAKLESRVASLELSKGSAKPAAVPAPVPKPVTNGTAKAKDDDDDDIDLFGSDEEEDKEAAELREKRLAEYAEKKSKKKEVIAKSSVILDVKPWDDETDMKKLEECVRSIQKDGLVWGVSKLMPVAFNIKKLQIVCVVEDDKVGIDDLSEEITAFDEYIQSVDIAAFQKI